MCLSIPRQPGRYRAALHAEKAGPERSNREEERPSPDVSPDAWVQLVVLPSTGVDSPDTLAAGGCCAPGLEEVQKALAEASRRQQLPDDYLDVTQGFLAGWKRRLKRKLLGNFKHAYVDVLSRQQSAFNRQVINALQELVECLGVLDHAHRLEPSPGQEQRAGSKFLTAAIERAVASGRTEEIAVLLRTLSEQVMDGRGRLAKLEERLKLLEHASGSSSP